MALHSVEIAFFGSTRQLEESLTRAGLVAKESGATIGDSFSKGSSKASSAVSKLSEKGKSFGLPFTSSLDAIASKLDEATTKTSKFSTVLGEAGKMTLKAGLAGFAAAAYEGVKGAMALQKQMEMIHTQAGASQQEVNKMTSAVEKMAGAVGTDPQQLAEGLYHVESTGMRGAKALRALTIAAQGAKVGNANLTDVTNALDSALVSNIKGVSNMQGAMGTLNATVGAGDMTMQDLADAMGTGITGTAKTFGLSLQDVGSALAVFGDNNIRGSQAATKLRQAIVMMGAPSAAASKALAAINLSQTQLAQDMRSGGLLKALEDLKQHLTDSGATATQQSLILSRAFGGGKTSSAIMLLINQLSRLQSKYTDIGKGASSFGQDWTATTHTLSFQMDALKATVLGLADRFGNYLIPKLESAAHVLGLVIDWFQKNKVAAEALGAVIGGVLGLAITVFAYQKAVAFVGGVQKMITGMASLATNIATKVGLINPELASISTEEGVVAEGATTMATTFDTQMSTMAGTAATEGTAIEGSMAGISLSIGSVVSGIAALGAGYSIGTILNKKFGISNKLDNLIVGGPPSQLQSEKNLLAHLGTVKQTTGVTKEETAIRGFLSHGGNMNWDVKSAMNAQNQAPGLAGYTIKNGNVVATASAHHVAAQHAATLHAVASGGATSGAGGAGSSAVANYLAAGTSTKTLALTPGQVNLEDAGLGLVNTINQASKGGTTFSQQGATVAAIHGAMGQQGAETSIVSSLSASGNPTLVKLANTISSDWKTMTTKLQTIVDSDTTLGQNKIASLTNALTSSNLTSLRETVTGIHRTQMMQLVTELRSVHVAALTNLASQYIATFKAAQAQLHAVEEANLRTQQGDLAEKQAQALQAETQRANDASQARITIAQDASQKEVDAIAAASTKLQDAAQAQVNRITASATAMTDAAQTQTDKFSAAAQAIQAKATTASDALGVAATKVQNAAQLTADAAKFQVTKIQDTSQKQQDAAAAEVQQIQIASQKLQDAAQAMATNIADVTQIATNAATGQASQIGGQAQLQSDIIGQRGLYGLQLLAQQQKIALDQQKLVDLQATTSAQAHVDQVKAATDRATAIAQQRLDTVTQRTDAAEAKSQQRLDTVTLQTATAEAKAQAHVDSITITTAAGVAKAQAHADAVAQQVQTTSAKSQQRLDAVKQSTDAKQAQSQAHVDSVTIKTAADTAKAQQHADAANISSEITISRAQYHADSTAISVAIKEASAQSGVDAAQFGTQLQQQQAEANLRYATGQGDLANAQAQSSFNAAQMTANTISSTAQNAYNQAQAIASQQNATATAGYNALNAKLQQQVAQAQAAYNLTQAQGSSQSAQAQAAYNLQQAQSALQNAQAQSSYQQAQNSASVQQANAQAAYNQAQMAASKQQANANAAYQSAQNQAAIQNAQAQQALAQATNSATVIEAKLQAQYQVTQELANTQFAGTGTVVNIYSQAANSAAAIADEFNWLSRSTLVTAY